MVGNPCQGVYLCSSRGGRKSMSGGNFAAWAGQCTADGWETDFSLPDRAQQKSGKGSVIQFLWIRMPAGHGGNLGDQYCDQSTGSRCPCSGARSIGNMRQECVVNRPRGSMKAEVAWYVSEKVTELFLQFLMELHELFCLDKNEQGDPASCSNLRYTGDAAPENSTLGGYPSQYERKSLCSWERCRKRSYPAITQPMGKPCGWFLSKPW